MHLHATHGSNAPNIRTLSIALPTGLSFRRTALVRHRVCKGTNCWARLSIEGLSLSAAVAAARIHAGKLVVTFTSPTASISLTAHGPLLTEKPVPAINAHQDVGALVARVQITDASGLGTVVSVM